MYVKYYETFKNFKCNIRASYQQQITKLSVKVTITYSGLECGSDKSW